MSSSQNPNDMSLKDLESRFVIRPMQLEDIPEVNQLGVDVGYNDGELNFLVYWEQHPEGWTVVADKTTGKLVAYFGMSKMSNGLEFGIIVYTDKSVRGWGITRYFSQNWQNGKFIGNASPHSIARYGRLFDVLSYKVVGYAGVAKSGDWKEFLAGKIEPKNTKTVPLTANLLEKALAYDATILPDIDRKGFMKKWLLSPRDPEYTRTYVALDKHLEICGIGNLRIRSGYWAISPLYANTDNIAIALIDRLMDSYHGQNFNMYIACNANNLLIARIAKGLHFQAKDVYYHHFSGNQKQREFHNNILSENIYGFIETCFPV